VRGGSLGGPFTCRPEVLVEERAPGQDDPGNFPDIGKTEMSRRRDKLQITNAFVIRRISLVSTLCFRVGDAQRLADLPPSARRIVVAGGAASRASSNLLVVSGCGGSGLLTRS
jgi:hypothetical protein